MLSAFDVLAGCLALDTGWSSNVFIFALAMKAADCVGADGVRTAGLRFALVDVEAGCALRDKAFLSKALVFYAFRVVCAIKVGFTQDIHINLKWKRKVTHVILRSYASR